MTENSKAPEGAEKAKMDVNGMKVDPEFLVACAKQAEKLLLEFANDPNNNPLIAQMIGVYLQRHGMAVSLLRGMVDLHNEAVQLNRDAFAAEGEGAVCDLSSVMNKLALLANVSVSQFGAELAPFQLEYQLDTGGIIIRNMNHPQPEGPQEGQDEPPAPGEAPSQGELLADEADPLLAAHNKGLH